MLFQFVTNRFVPTVTVKQANITKVSAGAMTEVADGLYEIELDDGVVIPLVDSKLIVGGGPELTPVDAVGIADGFLSPIFSSLSNANRYLKHRLHAEIWQSLTILQQTQSLITASQIINNLAFKGYKVDLDQLLEYPRTPADPGCCDGINCSPTSPSTPLQIGQATAELALSLSQRSGIDPLETEIGRLRVVSRRFSSVATTYGGNPALAPPNLEAGILSPAAWRLLQPFLEQSRSIHLIRVS